jgi:hypothetical protein
MEQKHLDWVQSMLCFSDGLPGPCARQDEDPMHPLQANDLALSR